MYFLDGTVAARARRDTVLSCAVAAGIITPVQAWPEFFGEDDAQDAGAFPSKDADMSAFALEPATPESVAADLDALLRENQRVTLREQPGPAPPQFAGLPDTEWP